MRDPHIGQAIQVKFVGIEGVNELEPDHIPLLEKGGVAAASIKRCEATESPQTTRSASAAALALRPGPRRFGTDPFY